MPQMPIQRQNGSRAEAVHMETRDSLTSPGAAVQGLASNDRTRVKSLTSKYVDQLLHGCDNSDCQQLLCHTGRLNTSARPVRKYTPRSARAVAMALCAAPNPEKFLCTYHKPRPCEQAASRREPSWPEGEQDVSSLIQLLCNTSAMRDCKALDYSLANELRPLHQKLNHALKYAGGVFCEAHGGPLPNSELVAEIYPCVDWLLRRLPPQRTAVWEMIDQDIISKGRAYPQKTESVPTDDKYNTWLAVLDVLDNEPCLRLLRRIMQVISIRTKLEVKLQTVKAELAGSCASMVGFSIASKLAATIMSTRKDAGNSVYALVVWLKKLFAREWDSNPVLAGGSTCHAIMELFSHLNCIVNDTAVLPTGAFLMPLIRSRASEVHLAQPYLEDFDGGVHLLEYKFLLPVDQVFLCFRTINHLRMRQAHADTLKAEALRQKLQSITTADIEKMPSQVQYAEEHYLLLNVRRTSVLQDTFDQLWQRRKSELRRPLRVRLGQTDELEVGHDLGGVQIEFFNLVCREIMAEDLQMFTTDAQTGLSYFQPCSLQPLHMFELFGVLVALAAYNGITLPIRMPRVFYKILFRQPGLVMPEGLTNCQILRDIWPNTVSSILSIARDGAYGLDFEFPLEANGLRLSVNPRPIAGTGKYEMRINSATTVAHHKSEDGPSEQTSSVNNNKTLSMEELPDSWPGWKILPNDNVPGEVTPQNKVRYAQAYTFWLAYISVSPQFDAFRRGFHDSEIFGSGRELLILDDILGKDYIEGTDTFEIPDLKAATRYDGYDPKSKYIQSFWKIVAAWPEEKQKQLLKFVTAAERIPITGVSRLVFIVKRANVENLENLPTSSTCFGTLMLPKYKSAEVLREKLSLALKFGSEGFGTG